MERTLRQFVGQLEQNSALWDDASEASNGTPSATGQFGRRACRPDGAVHIYRQLSYGKSLFIHIIIARCF
jgi:hypothetical protein